MDKVDISVWGPILWAQIDELARKYPNNPSEYEVETTFSRLWDIINSIPCDYCKKHAIIYILTDTNKVDLRSKDHFQHWVWKFHDSVNKRREKKGYKTNSINFEEYIIKQNKLTRNFKTSVSK